MKKLFNAPRFITLYALLILSWVVSVAGGWNEIMAQGVCPTESVQVTIEPQSGQIVHQGEQFCIDAKVGGFTYVVSVSLMGM